jgi:uncharacterized membrane protein YfcA
MELLSAMVFGGCAGALMYLSGVGGGVVVVPTLVGIFGMTLPVAVGTASAFSFVYKIGAGFSHQRAGNVVWPLLRTFLKAAAGVCLLCSLLVVWVMGQPGALASVVNGSLKLAIFVAGLLALVSLHSQNLSRVLQRLGLTPLACATGALVGATGTGGGILVTPALLATSGESAQRVVGTSLVIGLALSACTGVVFGMNGSIDISILGAMLLGALVSMPIARFGFERLSAQAICQLTSAAIVLALAMMTASFWRTTFS